MSSWFDKSVAGFSIFVIVVAAASNIVLIAVMIRKKKINKKPFEVFLFSMAFSDLFHVLTTALPFAVYKAQGTWTLGDVICQVYVIGRATFEKLSFFTIAFIGIESFRALKKVDGQAFSMTTTRVLIVTSWVTVFFLACPYAAWYKLTPRKDGSVMCNVDFYNSVTSAYTVFSRCTIVIPLVLVIICYSGVIYRTVKSQRQVADIQASSEQGQRRQTTIKVARKCIILAVMYIVCKVPFTIVLLHAQISRDPSTLHVAEVLWIISIANAATSPFVYGFLDVTKKLIAVCKFCGIKKNRVATEVQTLSEPPQNPNPTSPKPASTQNTTM